MGNKKNKHSEYTKPNEPVKNSEETEETRNFPRNTESADNRHGNSRHQRKARHTLPYGYRPDRGALYPSAPEQNHKVRAYNSRSCGD